MKHFRTILFVSIILLFILSACQSVAVPADSQTASDDKGEAAAVESKEENSESASASEEKVSDSQTVELEFWDYVGTSNEWIQNFITKYQDENPGVSIRYTAIPEVDFDEKLRTAMAAGSEPDITFVISGSSLIDYAGAGKIVALNDYVDQSLWTSSTLSALTYNNNLYAIPLGPMISPMWYNVKMFEENGVEVPETWDELLDTCDTFNQAGITPISFAMLERWEVMVYYDYIQHQLAGPGVMDMAAQGDGASFSDPEFVEAAQRVQELFDAKCFPEGTASLDSNQMAASFFNGDAAMIELGTWIIGMAKEQAPEDFEMAAFMFPALPGNVTGTEKDVLGGVNAFAITAKSPYPEQAADFLTAFAKENSDFVNSTGYLPSIPGVTVEEPLTNQLIGFFEGADNLYIWGDRRLPTAIVDDYLDNLVALAMKQLTPEEFGARMDEAVQQKVK